MAGEVRRAPLQLGIGDGAPRIAERDFRAAFRRMPPQQLRYRSDQIGLEHLFLPIDHRVLVRGWPHTMQKPPEMEITCPVIHEPLGEASRATVGAMSSGWPRRRSG